MISNIYLVKKGLNVIRNLCGWFLGIFYPGKMWKKIQAKSYKLVGNFLDKTRLNKIKLLISNFSQKRHFLVRDGMI